MLRPLHAQDSSTCAFLPQGVTTTPPAPSTHVPSALSGRRARAPAQRLHPQVLLLPGTDPLRSVLPQPALRSQQAIPHSGRPGLIATRFAPTASAKLCGSQSRARTFWETRAKLFPRIYPAAPRHRGALTCEDITTTAVAGCARSGVARSGIAEAGAIRSSLPERTTTNSQPRTTARSCSDSGSRGERAEEWTTLPAQLPAVCCPEPARLLMFSRQRGPDDPNGDRGQVRRPVVLAADPHGHQAARRRRSRGGPIDPAADAPKESSGHRRRGSGIQIGITVCPHVGPAAARSWRCEGGGCSALGGSAGECEAAACQDVSEEAKAIGHDAVDLEIEELVDHRLLVDRPCVHR